MTKANDSGQTLVETAISLSLFLLLVMGTIDFGYLPPQQNLWVDSGSGRCPNV